MSKEPLLDRAHLTTQTGGDDVLASELLALFADQCRRILPDLGDGSRHAKDRADLAHTLKGSALGVGARRVANLAASIEDRLRTDGDIEAPMVEELQRAVAATLDVAKTG